MDIDLARTFLEIVRHGSLAAAAQKLFVTQTAITARVQKLESQLGSTLFVRNRAGAKLTANGEAFVVYANQLVQTWEAARRDLPLLDGYHNVLHIGGEVSLCNPLMLSWAAELREKIPGMPCAWKSATAKTCCASLNSVCSMPRWSISRNIGPACKSSRYWKKN
jgi:DNA-binding transcriptional LysR family regulator